MRFAWKKTSGLSLVRCVYGTLLDVQYPDGSPCSDWRMVKCGEKPGVITVHAAEDGSGKERIIFDPLTADETERARIHTGPGEVSWNRYGLLRIRTDSNIYTFHQVLLPLTEGKCLGLVCDTNFLSFMQDMETSDAAVINIPDPRVKGPWTDMSDILYAEDIFIFRLPGSELSGVETFERMGQLKTDVCSFVGLTDAETVIVRCQYGTDLAYVRSAAMLILGWLVGMYRE